MAWPAGSKSPREMMTPRWGANLHGLRFFQSSHHAALIRGPDPDVAVPDDVAIEAVTSEALMEEFLTAYVSGWGIPEAFADQFKQNVRPWRRQPGWSLYLARVEDRPAAAATLIIRDRVGYFADSTTTPSFRGRGLHAALLRRRLRDASRAGVEFVCSDANFLSTSHRNMERAGMRLLFLRSIWTLLE